MLISVCVCGGGEGGGVRVSVSVCAGMFPVPLYDSFAQRASGAVSMHMLYGSFYAPYIHFHLFIHIRAKQNVFLPQVNVSDSLLNTHSTVEN